MNGDWTEERTRAGVPVTCPTCGGEGHVGGLIVGDHTIDELCGRCAGRGYIQGEPHAR